MAAGIQAFRPGFRKRVFRSFFTGPSCGTDDLPHGIRGHFTFFFPVGENDVRGPLGAGERHVQLAEAVKLLLGAPFPVKLLELRNVRVNMPGRDQHDSFYVALPVLFDKVGQVPSVRKGGVPADLGQDNDVESQALGFVDGHDSDDAPGRILPAGHVFHVPDPFIQGNALLVHLFRLILPDGQAVPVEFGQFRSRPGQPPLQFFHDGGVAVPFQQEAPGLPVHAFRPFRSDEGPEGGMDEQACGKGVSRHEQPAEEVQQVFSQGGIHAHRNVVAYLRGNAVVRQPGLDG